MGTCNIVEVFEGLTKSIQGPMAITRARAIEAGSSTDDLLVFPARHPEGREKEEKVHLALARLINME